MIASLVTWFWFKTPGSYLLSLQGLSDDMGQLQSQKKRKQLNPEMIRNRSNDIHVPSTFGRPMAHSAIGDNLFSTDIPSFCFFSIVSLRVLAGTMTIF